VRTIPAGKTCRSTGQLQLIKKKLLQACNRAIWLEHGKILMDDDAAKVAAAYFDKKS
jgi:ABC-type polysaccharide/polyol phosphate transport system ATPase subunit